MKTARATTPAIPLLLYKYIDFKSITQEFLKESEAKNG